ncbi:MAG: hypothetical protein H0W99_02870 [Acidobacteria bacterium]|nr:hypothetical protein [Acidobacteriota bacterium]
MNPFRRPLILIVIVLFLLGCGIAIARSGNIKSNLASAAAVECADDCKQKSDATTEKCDKMPEASRDNCRQAAKTHEDKCLEKCNGARTP